MRSIRAWILLPLATAACGGPQPPTQAEVVGAVNASLDRREVASRLVDQQICVALSWHVDAIERVAVLSEPQPDGGTNAWRVRVAVRGSWSGILPALPSPTTPNRDGGGGQAAPPAQTRKVTIGFDRVTDVRLIREADGSLRIP